MARTPRPWYRATHRQWYATVNQTQTPLGVRDPADEAGAWAALQRLLSGVDAIRDSLAAGKPRIRSEPFPELVRLYLDERQPVIQPVTYRGYAQYLGWLVKTFPTDTAASIDLGKLASVAARVETWGDTHRANVLAAVGALLRWAGRDAKIPRPAKLSRGAESVIPEPVYRRCLAESAGDFRQLLRFLWLTGCRPGEATGITVDAVAWDVGTIAVRLHKTRGKGKTRTIYLAKEALEVLIEQREKYGDGLLFRGLRGRRLGLQAMTMRFQRLSAKVGHTITSYCFRHTWATRALKQGIPAAHVAAMMGHSSTAMVSRHYGHLGAEAELLREQADRVAAKAAG